LIHAWVSRLRLFAISFIVRPLRFDQIAPPKRYTEAPPDRQWNADGIAALRAPSDFKQ
jgi:hypothetical protein